MFHSFFKEITVDENFDALLANLAQFVRNDAIVVGAERCLKASAKCKACEAENTTLF